MSGRPRNIREFTIVNKNIASFYRLLGKYHLALEEYQEIEFALSMSLFLKRKKEKEEKEEKKDLDMSESVFKYLTNEQLLNFEFSEESESKHINPITEDNIENSFVKELGKSELTVLRLKQWLLWSKIICLQQLKIPYLIFISFESYLQFLTQYQKLKSVPEMNSWLMMYQMHNKIRLKLFEVIAKSNELTELQQRFIYSSFSRFILNERQYLYKIVCKLYSIKSLSLNEQHEQNFKLLEYLLTSVKEFKEYIKRNHKRYFINDENMKILGKIRINESRYRLMTMNKVLEYDRTLQQYIEKYNPYALTNNILNCAPLVDLHWLLFYDPNNITKLPKAQNIDSPMWGLLFEYLQVHKLLINVLSNKEEEAFDITLKLCGHFLRKEHSKAKLLWKIALVIARVLNKKKVDVNGIFRVEEREENNIPHIILINPFDEFDIKEIFIAKNTNTIPFNQRILLEGENKYEQAYCKDWSNSTFNFVVEEIEFYIPIPDSLLANLNQKITLELFTPNLLRFDKNLMILSIEPNYYIEDIILEIELDNNSTIQEESIRIFKLNKNTEDISEVKTVIEDKINIPFIKGPKEVAYVALVIVLVEFENEPTDISFVVSLYQSNKSDKKLFKELFNTTLPKNILANIHVSSCGNSRIIQTEIDPLQYLRILKVDIKVEGIGEEISKCMN